MEYILKNIPAYEMANEQLKQISLRWEKEITDQAQKVEEMYKEYQSNAVFLTDAQKQQKEEEILEQDKATQDLRRKYFGPEGELFKKRESLMKPIQDDIYEAVKSISEGKRLPDGHRPGFVGKHHFCLSSYRHQQRSAVEVGFFQINLTTFVAS